MLLRGSFSNLGKIVMNWFKIHSFEWQINLKSWGFERSKSVETYNECDVVFSNYLIIGPFQCRWYS